MKIHMRPLALYMPSPQLPKPMPTTAQLQIRAEELTRTPQQQKARLKRIYDPRNKGEEPDDDGNPSEREHGSSSNKNVDFLA